MPSNGYDYGARGDGINTWQAKSKQTLKRSPAGYQEYLTKLYNETEVWMLDKENMELVNNKLKVSMQHSLLMKVYILRICKAYRSL